MCERWWTQFCVSSRVASLRVLPTQIRNNHLRAITIIYFSCGGSRTFSLFSPDVSLIGFRENLHEVKFILRCNFGKGLCIAQWDYFATVSSFYDNRTYERINRGFIKYNEISICRPNPVSVKCELHLTAKLGDSHLYVFKHHHLQYSSRNNIRICKAILARDITRWLLSDFIMLLVLLTLSVIALDFAFATLILTNLSKQLFAIFVAAVFFYQFHRHGRLEERGEDENLSTRRHVSLISFMSRNVADVTVDITAVTSLKSIARRDARHCPHVTFFRLA